jgi:hypothetical protein
MPVSSELYEQQRTVAEPAENVMFEREDFDRKGLRMEFADPVDLSMETDFVEREDKTLPDPRTLDMPVGPTGMGEVGGGAMETIRLEGERWPTYRYAHGFEMNREDANGGVERQRDYILETFDFLFDLNFMFGMQGIGHWDGMIPELRDRIPAERTFDCEDYDNDGTGNESGKPDFSAVPEDLVVGEAMQALRGEVIDINEGWQVAVGSHTAITQMNFSAGEDQDVERGPTFRERMRDADAVQNFVRLPYKTQLDYLPDDADADIPEFAQYDIVDTGTAVDPAGEPVIGNDELFLLPDMETVMGGYWDIRETATPQHYGPFEERQGRLAHDYVARSTMKADPTADYPEFADAIHLTNVSALFGS